MSDSKQLRIVKALCDHIEGITPTNGYQFDLTGKVFRGRAKFGSDQVLPFVTVLESLRADERPLEAGDENLVREDTWELLVQGFVDENREYPTDGLYQLKASVEKRLAEMLDRRNRTLYRIGGAVTSMRIGPGIVRAATPEPGGAEAFYLPLQVRYVINLSDPFA